MQLKGWLKDVPLAMAMAASLAAPAIGQNVLSIDATKGRYEIATLGASLQWVTENKVRAFDLGVELGGPTTNFSIGYRHDF